MKKQGGWKDEKETCGALDSDLPDGAARGLRRVQCVEHVRRDRSCGVRVRHGRENDDGRRGGRLRRNRTDKHRPDGSHCPDE
ncbi:hypothetical protein SDC9_107162 [bioreactor metagenome]|uniref:Uncharacterized protein n=1 Tax=bioreactor metagenome TaxID=1076179 RepID=A0A645B6R6_9ZZZZ